MAFPSTVRNWGITGLTVAIGLGLVYLGYVLLSAPAGGTLRLGAGHLNGEPYEVAAAIAQVIRRAHPAIKVELVETGGSSENMHLLSIGKLDLALAQADAVSRENVTLVARLYPDVFQLMVRPESGIKTLKDLEGKTVALPPVTSSQYSSFWFLANHYLLAPELINVIPMNDKPAAQAIIDGNVDAIFRVRGPRNVRIRRILGQVQLDMIPIDQGPAMHLRQPAFNASQIPKGTYRGQPPIPESDLPTVSVDRLLLARADIRTPLIRAITSVLFEKRRELLLHTPLAAFIRQPQVASGTLLPVHPGALEYFDREKPSVLEEKAEFLAFLLSFTVLLGTVLIAIQRRLAERKKGRVEDYTVDLIALEREAKKAETIAALNIHKQKLTDMLAQVIDDVHKNRVRSDGLQLFTFTWESVNYTINDHEEQLRLGSETTGKANGKRRSRRGKQRADG